ncbi:MAG: hypothetical protein LBB88_07735 [Planctomycetaceae bacterium]|nr:hypothetical protein [Planctomycetaceae bacterium]
MAFFFELLRLFCRGAIRNFFAVFWLLIGFSAHTIFLYYRHVVSSNYVNGAEIYFLTSAWSLILIYCYLSCYHRDTPFGLFFLPISILLIIGGFVISYNTPYNSANSIASHNPPILKMFHAITFFLATSSICIGFVAGLLYLVQDWRLKHKKPVGILKLPSIEWSGSICKKALGASTFILAATIYYGWLLQPQQSKSPNTVLLNDPLVIGTILMFVFLILFSGILPLRIFKTEGKQVAVLTLITFLFLALTVSFGILSKNSHWKRITPKEKNTAALSKNIKNKKELPDFRSEINETQKNKPLSLLPLEKLGLNNYKK